MRSVIVLPFAFGLSAALHPLPYERRQADPSGGGVSSVLPSTSGLFPNSSTVAPTDTGIADPTAISSDTQIVEPTFISTGTDGAEPTATGTGDATVDPTATGNTTQTAAPVPVTLTTSTVISTKIHTITQCLPEVVDCPARNGNGPYVTTELIPLYTTVCPAGEPQPTAGHWVTKPGAAHTTQTYTITKCGAEVVDCPVGKVTTEVGPGPQTVVFVPTGAAPPKEGQNGGSGCSGEGACGGGVIKPPKTLAVTTKPGAPAPSATLPGGGAPPAVTAGAASLAVGIVGPVALFGAQLFGL